jgi:hypothetical protein
MFFGKPFCPRFAMVEEEVSLRDWLPFLQALSLKSWLVIAIVVALEVSSGGTVLFARMTSQK